MSQPYRFVVASVFVLGLAGGVSLFLLARSHSQPAPAAAAAALTQEQEQAWDTLRRKNRETPWDVAYRDRKSKQWFTHAFALHGPQRGFPTQESVEEAALGMAGDGSVDMAVALNLFGQRRPRILSWYYDDGITIGRHEQPPKAEDEASLRAALEHVQREQ